MLLLRAINILLQVKFCANYMLNVPMLKPVHWCPVCTQTHEYFIRPFLLLTVNCMFRKIDILLHNCPLLFHSLKTFLRLTFPRSWRKSSWVFLILSLALLCLKRSASKSAMLELFRRSFAESGFISASWSRDWRQRHQLKLSLVLAMPIPVARSSLMWTVLTTWSFRVLHCLTSWTKTSTLLPWGWENGTHTISQSWWVISMP